MNKVKIGIMSIEQYKQRIIAIAKGEYQPGASEPQIWFTSIKSLANLLSEDNQHLLKLIIDNEPQSVSELEELTDYTRRSNNILRTLRQMEQYGLVSLVEGENKGRGRAPLIPKALYDAFEVEFALQ